MSSGADRLNAIRDKVEAGQRLSFEDGRTLEASNDLFALGSMANLVRERYNSNFAYFNVNTHINPTNVCVYTCDFCAFRADMGEERAYVMDRDQIVERATQAAARGATEMHVVGGLHNKLPFDFYLNVVRWIKETAPEIHIKAYTAVEIEWFCKITRQSVEVVLRELIDAGLGSLPGGGAEIFHPEVREQICAPKRRPRAGSTSIGLPTGSACTPTCLPCSTATSTGPNIGSTTWFGSANCRMRLAGSRPSSHWRSIPIIRKWPTSRSRRVSWI